MHQIYKHVIPYVIITKHISSSNNYINTSTKYTKKQKIITRTLYIYILNPTFKHKMYKHSITKTKS